MTVTVLGCPLHYTMSDWIERAVGKLPGVDVVEVCVTVDPPWTPDRISPERRT